MIQGFKKELHQGASKEVVKLNQVELGKCDSFKVKFTNTKFVCVFKCDGDEKSPLDMCTICFGMHHCIGILCISLSNTYCKKNNDLMMIK